MRVKRQRQTRKHLRFFRTECGFREPFKVLCDGNFLHHVLALKLTPAPQSLPKLLGSPTQIYTTKCVIAELRQLGADFRETTFQARKLLTCRCEHDPPVPPSECLAAAVSQGNPHHFLVATQDAELRARLGFMPGAAVIRAQGTALALEAPSEEQLAQARQRQESVRHLPEHERVSLQTRRLAAGGAPAGSALAGEGGLVRGRTGLFEKVEAEDEDVKGEVAPGTRVDWRKGYGQEGRGDGGLEFEDALTPKKRRQRLEASKDVPRFKRKRVKGPNPLSCKKKKEQQQEPQVQAKATLTETPTSRKKRKRRAACGSPSD